MKVTTTDLFSSPYIFDPTESFLGLVKSFQEAFRNHVPDKGNLYDPDEMKAFCEENSPGLFDLLEKVITSDYSMSSNVFERRSDLRRQRVVGELHRLAYLANQVLFSTIINRNI